MLVKPRIASDIALQARIKREIASLFKFRACSTRVDRAPCQRHAFRILRSLIDAKDEREILLLTAANPKGDATALCPRPALGIMASKQSDAQVTMTF
jgi:hypothetical protein